MDITPSQDIVVMGRIAAPYGVKGWLKILPSTSEHDTLLDHCEWWLRRRGDSGAWEKATLAEGRAHGNTPASSRLRRPPSARKFDGPVVT